MFVFHNTVLVSLRFLVMVQTIRYTIGYDSTGEFLKVSAGSFCESFCALRPDLVVQQDRTIAS